MVNIIFKEGYSVMIAEWEWIILLLFSGVGMAGTMFFVIRGIAKVIQSIAHKFRG